MDIANVVVSGAVGAITSAITAYFTSKLKISEEKAKWYRDFTSKYSEALATNPAIAERMSSQFAIAVVIVTDLSDPDGERRKFFIMPNSHLTVGRAPLCDIVVTESVFSRQQLVFSADLTDVFVNTVGGRHRDFFNGEEFEGRKKLRERDIVKTGNTTFSIVKLS